MNREEAIICLQGLLENPLMNKGSYLAQAIEMAIKALSQEPCDDATLKDIFCMGCEYREQEPCDDAISRQAVLDGLKGCICEEWTKTLFATMVKQLPSVNPQPSEHFINGVHAMGYREGYKDAQKQKSGKWIRVTDKTGHLVWECDKCSWQQRLSTNFCPDCGVKMESEG